MLVLDHIAVLGETLEEASSHVESALGQPMLPGGDHPRFGTHNKLLGMAPEVYLEAIAIDPSAPPPPSPRWFGLDGFKGPARLDKWILRTEDLDASLKALPMAGKRVELSRGTLSWSMAVPEDGCLPFDGLFPALIQWHSAVPPGKALAANGLHLRELVVSHPEVEALHALLAPHLDAPLVRFVAADKPSLAARIDTGGETAVLR